MRLTPDLLAAAYSLLRETEPFRRWNLPDAEEIRFEVVKTRAWQGEYVSWQGEHSHRIRISQWFHKRIIRLLETMAHEMLHLHMREAGAKQDSHRHGPAFKKLCRLVLRHHPEFDPVGF